MEATTTEQRSPASSQIGPTGDAFVTFMISDQLFGVPVLSVQDILCPDGVTPIPLAPHAIKGSINVRGKIVTVIDVRTRLGLPAAQISEKRMGVTVEHCGELYTLIVDRLGDVATLPDDRREEKPVNLDPVWREVAQGLYRLDEGIMVVLDVDHLLTLS